MAVTTLNLGYIPEKGINYTHMTDSSTDWASVANSTYFYDKTDKLVHYKDSTGVVLEVFTQGGVLSTRTISTTSPLSGGGNLSEDRTLSIQDAAADGTTKGAATFTASDFNSASGVISIDYTNGQVASASNKGFLTSADWTTFNGKQDALGYTPENVANKSNSALDSDTTKYPTNNAVKTYVDGIVVGLWDDRGSFSAAGGSYPSTGGSGTAGAILKGDIWTISVAGTLPTGQVVELGDTVRALTDSPGNTQSNWAIQQNNIGYVPANSTLTISTNSPLSGGGDLSTNRTLSISDAAADGTTKGAATFTASDFNSSAGLISIDYTNGQAASASNKGFLTSSDWTAFNNKLSSTIIVAGTGTGSTLRDCNTNTASAACATVTGGASNTVNKCISTISGGICNTVSSFYSTIGGGSHNSICDLLSVGSSVGLCTASGNFIGGGSNNSINSLVTTLSAYYTLTGGNTITGGELNCIVSTYSAYSPNNQGFHTIGGGYSNNISAERNTTVSGGVCNTASESSSTIGGGVGNTASGNSSTVSGGYFNTASGCNSTIGGGVGNTASALYSKIGGGYGNTASCAYSTIGGGGQNNATCFVSTISGGKCNTASGECSTVSGGYRHCASSCGSAILGGICNNTSTYAHAMIVGSNITATKACTTHVNNLNIVNTPTTDSGSLDSLVWDPSTKEVKKRAIAGSGDAAADGVTKGVATFTASDFNSASGVISLDYTNAQAASSTLKGFLTATDWTTFNGKQNAISLTTTGSSGAATFITNTLNIPTYTLSGLGGVSTARQLTINGTAYDLTADRSWSVGTVTSVAELTLGTTGTDISSSVATGTSTPVITLNVPTASALNRGALSSADWTTFNGKVATTRTISTTSPLSGGGDLSSNLTLSIAEAAADGTTKGVATFTALDFDSTSGVISIDYANAQAASSTLKGFLTSGDWTTFNGKVATTRTISTTSPLSGGGDLSSNLTISIAEAVADDTTKGVATFNSSDFNSASGVISIDYTNAHTASSTLKGFLTSADWTTFNDKVATTRTISTTAPLSGGGDLSANRTLSITDAAADGTTKGAATFTASDFNATAGVISIDYTNGQAASASAKGFLTSSDWTTFNNKLDSTIMVAGTGTGSTIRDGNTNTATCAYSTVSGGCANTVSSCYSVISGGNTNSIATVTVGIYPATAQVINGGTCNRICATSNSGITPGGNTISGGLCNVINTNSNFSVITGGQRNTLSGNYAVLSGGCGNTASGYGSILIGGICNTASGYQSFIGTGFTSTASGFYSTIVGGGRHTASGCYSSILGGRQNTTSGRYSTIVGGHYNTITGATLDCSRGSFIGGGNGHNNSGGTVNATTGKISGLITCCNVGAFSTIGGGLRNCATSDYSAILGGRCNNASTYADAMIIGSCITATKACTTHVNSLNIVDTPTTDTASLDALSWDPTSKEVKLRNINGIVYAMSSQTVFI